MTNTANYQLPQWEATDRVKRSDFNAAMQSIDGAIAGAGRVCAGSWTGNGTYGESHPNTLTFDFTPKVLILFCSRGASIWGTGGDMNHTILLCGVTTSFTYSSRYTSNVSYSGNAVSWYTTDASASAAIYQLNQNGYTYYYAAIG